jgi:hypothetical protein
MRKFDSVETFFKLQDRWYQAAPYLLAISAFFILPALAGWISR